MIDNEFQVLFNDFESKYETFLKEIYPVLPKEIIRNLSEFIESYDISNKKYTVFVNDFNEYYKKQLISMLGGDSNLLFFGIRTKYHENENLWNLSRDYAINAYENLDDSASMIIILKVLLTVLKHDGFRIATEIYKDK